MLDGQTGKQITVPSPYRQAGSPAGSLHRPGLRVGTKQAVYDRYTALPDGSYRDKVSREIIKPPIQIGHAYGWENRRLLRAGEELGMSQKQLNDYVNDRSRNSTLFRLENGPANMSRRHEKPGNGELQRIKEDMVKFLRERNHQ